MTFFAGKLPKVNRTWKRSDRLRKSCTRRQSKVLTHVKCRIRVVLHYRRYRVFPPLACAARYTLPVETCRTCNDKMKSDRLAGVCCHSTMTVCLLIIISSGYVLLVLPVFIRKRIVYADLLVQARVVFYSSNSWEKDVCKKFLVVALKLVCSFW